jgi:hypothetical protein
LEAACVNEPVGLGRPASARKQADSDTIRQVGSANALTAAANATLRALHTRVRSALRGLRSACLGV